MFPIALSIAGSDPSGGAGIQADLKTFQQRDVYGMAAVTLITIQNTQCVREVHCLNEEQVRKQIDCVLEDIRPNAVKTGALGNESIIEKVSEAAAHFDAPLVIDPVMISKHGASLMAEDARRTFRERLLPLAFLLTPNLHEAQVLSGIPIKTVLDMEQAARKIAEMGPQAVLIKGGHLDSNRAVDLLLYQNRVEILEAERIESQSTHGTGCTFSACITAELAKGKDLIAAVRIAKRFITSAIRLSVQIGKGIGPVNHFVVTS